MRRRSLTELANNPDLISGIYNYCDRWCERCPLTSRCLVYATEQEDNDSPESRDIHNEAFWKKLNSIFQETREMIADWASTNLPLLAELGIDPVDLLARTDAVMDDVAEVWRPFAERFGALARGELVGEDAGRRRELPLLGNDPHA